MHKIISAVDAIGLIQDGDTIASVGYGGNGNPEQLFVSLEERFLESGHPKDLTLVFAGGQGDGKDLGLNRLGHEGLLKRVIGGHYGLIPSIERLAVENKIEAYNFPEGVICHLYRDIAAGKPGTLSNVGVGTFIDPRIEGGKVNDAAQEDLVDLVVLHEQETLFYRAFPIHVALVRGTTADAEGNVTMEKEALRLESLAMAMAAKNSGGIVICQVERVAQSGSLDARRVRLPGIFVDAVVVAQPEYHKQNYGTQYNPALSGEVRIPLKSVDPLPLDAKKVIARRAAQELMPNAIVNLGVGLPDAIGVVANEEQVSDLMTLTGDPGVYGGVPLGGYDFGAAVNFSALVDHQNQFDYIDGGGLDIAFLGFAECDAKGSVNASRFASRVSGCGGFINISQKTPKVVFVGTFTSGGFEAEVEEGALRIKSEGRHGKFVRTLGQVTFNGPLAAERGQEVLFVTERCVFRVKEEGLSLVEVAPGVDLQKDILDRMPFKPQIDSIIPMDPRIFGKEPLGLREHMLDLRIEDRLEYNPQTNTIFMNFAGMRVRTEEDLYRIKDAVDAILKPLGKRVNAIVNYDRFEADPEVMPLYLDLVRYVETHYYQKVSRYTNSGFMRLKLGQELSERRVSSRVFESRKEAEAAIRNGK